MTPTATRSISLLRSVWFTIVLAAAAAVLAACPAGSSWLEFDREAVYGGQLWRIITCHLTHCNLDHLLWDVLALVVLGAMCERRSRSRYLMCLAACSAAIPAALLVVQPELLCYRGLSGLDTGLFALLAVGLLWDKSQERDWLGLSLIGLSLAGFAGKIAFELTTGNTVFVDSAAAGFTAVPLAHLVGLAVGAAAGLKEIEDNLPSRLDGVSPIRSLQ
jgi:rhomboid family GlyGly-CTERM serine protease